MMVADSDVLIDALRGKDPAASRIALELETGALATTAISVFELRSGAKKAAEHRKVDRLLAALQVLPFDSAAAAAASKVRLALEAEGLGIGMADYLIAGICLARSSILLTRNRKHFERVPGLRLGNLTDSGG